MIKKNSLVLVLAALLPLAATAQWLWLDEAGRRVYSDQPPAPAVPPSRILRQPGVAAPATWSASSPASEAAVAPASPRPSNTPAASTAPAPRGAASSPERAAGEDDRVRILQEHNARLRAAHCAQIRQAWNTLESGQRLARILPNGEREVLDDAGRAAERLRLQGILASDCAAL